MKLFSQIKKIHLIGIGGISMAGIAVYLKKQGKIVSGSDSNLCESPLYEKLIKSNIVLYDKHSIKNIKKYDLVVYSGAIDKNNCELKYAQKLNTPIIERSDLLGIICNQFKETIAICGSHGKTTTTALTGYIFSQTAYNPTIHIGGISNNLKSNFIVGKNNLFITEACEFNKSFLKLQPTYTAITNIDLDHLDCYKNIEEIEMAFKQFAHQTKKHIIYNGDNIGKEFFKGLKNPLISFGLNEYNDYYIKYLNDKIIIFKNQKEYIETQTILSGDYNLLNIVCGTAIADILGIDKDIIAKSIAEFSGVKRRFEFIKNYENAKIYIDYAHHPNEIKALLENCKKMGFDKVVAIFQPHTYSRTKGLFNEFLHCFDACDELALIPTYPARESEIVGGRSQDLFEGIKKIRPKTYFLNNKDEIKKFVNHFKNQNNLILFIGAGDIEKLSNL